MQGLSVYLVEKGEKLTKLYQTATIPVGVYGSFQLFFLPEQWSTVAWSSLHPI